MTGLFCGIDIGTGSSKAVLANEHGTVVASATHGHVTANPHPGHFEHDAETVWWQGFRALLSDLSAHLPAVRAVSISGIGPVALLTDASGTPLRQRSCTASTRAPHWRSPS